jgi:multiple sugar transport system ATP-binding protein
MAKVELQGVCKLYDGAVKAVDNANITVEDREFVVFVGPSGCGKSTTLRMIAGLEEISEGALYIDGEKMNDVPPKDRNIAMVFQNYALYPYMSVYENMSFGLKIKKSPGRKSTNGCGKRLKFLTSKDCLAANPSRFPAASGSGSRWAGP